MTNMKVSVEFERMPQDCVAFQEGCPFGWSVMGYEFGSSGPSESREESLRRVLNSIEGLERYYKQEVIITEIIDNAGFGISRQNLIQELLRLKSNQNPSAI